MISCLIVAFSGIEGIYFIPLSPFLPLAQSGYFSSMFSGSWKESNESCISLDIPDLNITREGMCFVVVVDDPPPICLF